MIEKGSMFKAWEATTEQQKKAHEMQAIYKAQETARQAIQEAMNRYIKKKTRARSVAKAEADPFAELEGWESLEQIQEAYGYGEITSDRRDKLTDLWEAREAAQRKGKKDGKYHDLVTDMLARAIHSVGIEYADAPQLLREGGEQGERPPGRRTGPFEPSKSRHCNGYAGRQGFGSNRCTVAETSYMETWIL